MTACERLLMISINETWQRKRGMGNGGRGTHIRRKVHGEVRS